MKKNKYIGYSSKEIAGMKRYDSEQKRLDDMIKLVFKHLQFMGYMALRDRYGFGKTRLVKYWKNVESIFEQYGDRKIGSKELLTYCEQKGIDTYGWMRSIPQSQKLILADYKKNHSGTLNTFKVIDSAILLYGVVSAVVLKEEFGFSSNKIVEMYGHLTYYIDSYARDYLTDDMVNEILIDECGIDMLNGVTV